MEGDSLDEMYNGGLPGVAGSDALAATPGRRSLPNRGR
jgi:hypothetical protein